MNIPSEPVFPSRRQSQASDGTIPADDEPSTHIFAVSRYFWNPLIGNGGDRASVSERAFFTVTRREASVPSAFFTLDRLTDRFADIQPCADEVNVNDVAGTPQAAAGNRMNADRMKIPVIPRTVSKNLADLFPHIAFILLKSVGRTACAAPVTFLMTLS
jgi:hypothetical protein